MFIFIYLWPKCLYLPFCSEYPWYDITAEKTSAEDEISGFGNLEVRRRTVGVRGA